MVDHKKQLNTTNGESSREIIVASFFKRALGIAYVEPNGQTIEIGGITSKALAYDIQRIWKTSKIAKHMFVDIGRKYVEFKTFFALEVSYMLRKIMEDRYHSTRNQDIVEILRVLDEETWVGRLRPNYIYDKILDRSKLNLFHKTPLPHQLEFFDRYEHARSAIGLNGFLLSAAAGSGKTLTDLMTAEMVNSDYIIIVSPNNAVDRVWQTAMETEFKKPPSYWTVGSGKDYRNQRYLITHYEGLGKLLQVARRLSGNVTIVLDESHNFNELRSLRTQQFIELCKMTRSQNVIWASGTPIKALGGEAIPLLMTIDPLFDEIAANQFKKIFGIDARRALDILCHRMGIVQYRTEKVVDNKPTERTINVKLPDGDHYTLESMSRQMTDYISERMAHYSQYARYYESTYNEVIAAHRSTLRTTEEKRAFEEYQDKFRRVKQIPDPKITGDLMREVNLYEKNRILVQLRGEQLHSFRKAKSVVKYPKLVVVGEALGNVLGKARSELQVKLIRHVDWDDVFRTAMKKTVIFTSYVEVVKSLNEYFLDRKMVPIMAYGDTNKDLSSNLKAFETNNEIDPLIATYPSLSTAVPLIMADQAVFTNVPFRDHELVQAKARIDRLGQNTPVKFVYVFLDTGNKPNISTRSRDILEWSKEQVAAILGQDYSGDVTLESFGIAQDLGYDVVYPSRVPDHLG